MISVSVRVITGRRMEMQKRRTIMRRSTSLLDGRVRAVPLPKTSLSTLLAPSESEGAEND